MSEENVTRVLETLDAAGRADIDAVIALSRPDVEFVNPDYAVESGTRVGHAGLRTALEATFDIFEEVRWDVTDVVDLDDRIVVTGWLVARAKGSGVGIDQPFGHVVTLEDGELKRIEWFNRPEEARAAAGLKTAGAPEEPARDPRL